MASLSAEIATTFLSFTSRPQNSFYKIRTTVLPVFFKPRARNLFCKTTPSLSSSSSFQSKIIAVNVLKPHRRFWVSATATTAAGDADVETMIPPDNRIPATIITGFLGSGKVCFTGLKM